MAAQSGPIFPADDPTKLPKLETTAVASLPTDPASKALYLASKIFPGLDPKDAIKRMGFDGSRLYYIGTDNKPYYAEPPDFTPLSSPKQTLATLPDKAAQNIGPSMPAAGAIIGGATTPEFGAGIPGATAGGASGEALRQWTANLLTKEQRPFMDRITDVGNAALEGAAGQTIGVGLGAGVGKLVDRNPLKVSGYDASQLSPARLAEIKANSDLAKSQGITTTPGEAGNVPSLLANQRQLMRQPEGATTMGDFYTKRNAEQIPQAWQNVMKMVSPQASSATANRGAQAAAGDAIDAAVDARRAVSQPLYKATVNAQALLSDADFQGLIKNGPDGLLLSQAIRGVRANPLLSPLIRGMPNNSLPVLDLTKRYLDGLAGTADRAGNATEAGVARNAAGKLTDQLDALFPDYKKARDAYAGASPEVDALKNGPVGVAAADRATGYQNIARTLLDPTMSDDVAVRQSRDAFMKAGKGDDWDAMTRSYLQSLFDDAAKQKQGPAPALWQKVVGDPRTMKNLKEALGPDQFDALNDFMKVMDQVKRAPAEGSPTTTDLGSREKMASPVSRWSASVVRGVNPLNIPDQVASKLIDVSSGKNIAKLADAITQPDAVDALKKLRVLQPGTKQWIRQITNLSAAVGTESAKDTLGMPQQPIPLGGIQMPEELSPPQ